MLDHCSRWHGALRRSPELRSDRNGQLMRGLAGITYQLLRLDDPARLPSLLSVI